MSEEMDPKERCFLQAGYSAWFSLSTEIIKQQLLLSSGAIGLLLSFFHGTIPTQALGLWIAAVCCFILVIVIHLSYSLQSAKKIISNELSGDRDQGRLASMRKLERLTQVLFVGGIVLSVFFVLSLKLAA